MNTEELKRFIKTHRVIEQTIDGFWNYINNWKTDNPDSFLNAFDGIDPASLVVSVKKISLTINYLFEDEYVQSYASIHHNSTEVAVYHYLISFNGECIDDVLSWEVLD